MDPALTVSTPILVPVQISKKQTVVGNTYLKVFFFGRCHLSSSLYFCYSCNSSSTIMFLLLFFH